MQKTQGIVPQWPWAMLGAYGFLYGVLFLADWTSPLRDDGMAAFRALTGGLVAYLGLIALAGWRRVAYGLLGVSAFNALVAVVQFAHTHSRVHGAFSSDNYFGSFCGLAVFLALALRRWELAVLSALGLVMSGSRAAIFGAIVGLFFVVPPRWRWAWLALPLAAVGVYFLHTYGDSLTPRLSVYFVALKGFATRPVLGWGQGTLWRGQISGYYSIYATWAVVGGICGLAAFGWACVETAKRARGPWLGLCAAYLTNGVLMHDSRMAGAVMVLAVWAIGCESLGIRAVSQPDRNYVALCPD